MSPALNVTFSWSVGPAIVKYPSWDQRRLPRPYRAARAEVVLVVVLSRNRNEVAVWCHAGNGDHLRGIAVTFVDHELPCAGSVDSQLVFVDAVKVGGTGRSPGRPN